MGKRVTIALAVFAFLAMLLMAYVAGYVWLGERSDWRGARVSVAPGKRLVRFPEIVRVYPYQWLATAFRPAGRIEGRLVGAEVDVQAKGEPPDIRTLDIAD